MLPAQRRVTSACEACHKQKIKCRVSLWETTCQACQKSQRPCIFVRRGVGGRPRKTHFIIDQAAEHQQPPRPHPKGPYEAQVSAIDWFDRKHVRMNNAYRESFSHQARDPSRISPNPQPEDLSLDKSVGSSNPFIHGFSPTNSIPSDSRSSLTQLEGYQIESAGNLEYESSSRSNELQKDAGWLISNSSANLSQPNFESMSVNVEQEQSIHSISFSELIEQFSHLQQVQEGLDDTTRQSLREVRGRTQSIFSALDDSCRMVFRLYREGSSTVSPMSARSNTMNIALLAILVISFISDICHSILGMIIPHVTPLDRLLRLKQLDVDLIQVQVSLVQIGDCHQLLLPLTQEVMKRVIEAKTYIRSQNSENAFW